MRITTIAALSLLALSPSSVVAFASSPPSSFISSGGGVTNTRSTSSLFGYIDVSERTTRAIDPFERWADQCGIQQADGFQLSTQDRADYSVVTNEYIPAGQPVLVVPSDMVLSSSVCQQELMAMSNGGVSDAVDILGRIGGGLSVPEFYLTLKILVEFEKGDQSYFFPWLNSLPRLYYNAVSMTSFCYECLPPLVFSLSREERLKFDNFMEVLSRVDVISNSLKQDLDVIMWAFNVVHTRCWGEPGQDRGSRLVNSQNRGSRLANTQNRGSRLANTQDRGSRFINNSQEKFLVPMADMFNHGTDTEVELTFDDEGNCLAYTTIDVQAGSPLRLSYGDPANPSAFFAKYGFLDETSPATFCKIMNIQPTPDVIAMGYDFSRMVFYRDTGEISEEVWDVVLYAKVLANKPGPRKQFYNAHMSGDANTKAAIHHEYFLETTTEIKNHVDTFLFQLDELSRKAVGQNMGRHPRLPLILRHNDFIRHTFVRVKERLDPMVTQAWQAQM